MSLFTPTVRSPRGRLRSGRWRSLGRNSRPRLESLEERVVPSVVDLTTLGSSGTINGAIFRQGQVSPSGTGNIRSFVRLHQSPTEFGYNTDARPFTDPVLVNGGTDSTANFTRSLRLSDVPIVSIGGQAYLDFALVVNQTGGAPLLSLDEVQVSLAPSNTLGSTSSSYYTTDGTYGGNASLVYDMDGSSSTWVKLNYGLSPGAGGNAIYMDVPLNNLPDSAFSGPDRTLPLRSDSFVYLYSHFGDQYAANGGIEEWATPARGTATSATSTTIYDATTNQPIVNPGLAGISVKDSATVTGSGGVPTGNVTFLFYHTSDGTGPVIGAGTVALNSGGVANYSDVQGPLPPGAYSFIALYSGDANYLPSESAVEPLTIQPRQATVQTTINEGNKLRVLGPLPLGTSVYDTATIGNQASSLPATGTVTYQFYTTIDGTGPHTDETVTLNPDGTVPDSALHGPLEAGAYSFIAVYSGDGNYLGSSSAVEPLRVLKGTTAAVTEILDVNGVAVPFPYEVPLGTSVRDAAVILDQVPGLPATGTVTYEFFTTIDGTGPSIDEVVTLNPDGTVPDSVLRGPLAAGSYSFIAVYSGDRNYAATTSAVEPLTVGSATSALVTEILDVNGVAVPFPYEVPLGTSVRDAAAITGQHPGVPATGTVTYQLFATIDGTGPHTDEVVTLNPDGSVPDSALHGPLEAGPYSFVTVYSGDGNYPALTSAVEPLTVQQGTSTAATVIVGANHTPITSPVPLGTRVRDTATVAGTPTAFSPTGTVTYLLFTTIDGTGPYTDETVALNPDGSVPDSALHGPLAAGSHSFIAVYSGDSNYAGSISAVEPLTVQQGTSTAATVIVDPNGVPVTSPVPLGMSVRDTATIGGQVPGLPATGTLTYELFTTIDGSGTPTATEVVALNPDGSVPDSALHGPLAASSYSFIATYSGDRNYQGSTSAVEPLRVLQDATGQQGALTFATVIVGADGAPVASPVPLGTSVRDTATIGGQVPGLPATGTVTYEFFATIDGTGPSIDEVVTLNPDGSVPDSALHGPLAAGSFSFIAAYSGDDNYLGSTSPVEPLTVQQGTSTSATVIVGADGVPVTSPVPLGTSVRDTATIGGQLPGLPATGTVTYEFFATMDGTGPHVDEVVHLNPDGSVPDSALHGPLAAGSFSFIAVYSGDSNYAGSTSLVEPLTVQSGPSVAPSVTSLQRFGYHAHPTRFVLTFSTALEPASAEDVANYRLKPILGQRLGRAIPLKKAIYDSTTNTVTLKPIHRVYLFNRYRLEVNGSTPKGVAGATGLLLDGKGNGQPGSDFVTNFGKEILFGKEFLSGLNTQEQFAQNSVRIQNKTGLTLKVAAHLKESGRTLATIRDQTIPATQKQPVLIEFNNKTSNAFIWIDISNAYKPQHPRPYKNHPLGRPTPPPGLHEGYYGKPFTISVVGDSFVVTA